MYGIYRVNCDHPNSDKNMVYSFQSCGWSIYYHMEFLCNNALLWIIYGFYNKRFAIWATNVIYLILYIIIVVGIVLKAGWTW